MNPIIIIGAGPAGLMAAQTLGERGFHVEVYEQMNAAARKFLVAGYGGFNLTHSMPYSEMLLEYTPQHIVSYISAFTNKDTIQWLAKIGIETYVGSSGKIFPAKHIKPIQVLQAWLSYLKKLKVVIHYRYEFIDFDATTVTLKNSGVTIKKTFQHLILGLGGASWPQTGATGLWTSLFAQKQIQVQPLLPANVGWNTVVDFSHLEGQVLKNVTVFYKNISKKGDVVLSHYGIEGSPVYYLNRALRNTRLPETIFIDLKPDMSMETLSKILYQNKKKNTTTLLKQYAKLSKPALQLLKLLSKDIYTNKELLAKHIKAYPLIITAYRPIAEAISTSGGVAWQELQTDLSLRKYPNVFCIGEMLDWEAPTGGYLLQACFAMGFFLGNAIKER